MAGMASFGLNFGAIVNLLILTAVYFLGVGVPSLIAKGLKKHFLETGTRPKRKTYWVKFNQAANGLSDFFRQF